MLLLLLLLLLLPPPPLRPVFRRRGLPRHAGTRLVDLLAALSLLVAGVPPQPVAASVVRPAPAAAPVRAPEPATVLAADDVQLLDVGLVARRIGFNGGY